MNTASTPSCFSSVSAFFFNLIKNSSEGKQLLLPDISCGWYCIVLFVFLFSKTFLTVRRVLWSNLLNVCLASMDWLLFLKFFCLSLSSAVSPKVLVLKLVAFYLWPNVKCYAGLVKSISSVLCQCFFFVSHPLVVVSYLRITLALPLHSLWCRENEVWSTAVSTMCFMGCDKVGCPKESHVTRLTVYLTIRGRNTRPCGESVSWKNT